MTASAIPTGTDSAAGMRCKAQTRLAPHGRAWGTPRRQGQALRALRGPDGMTAGARLHSLAAQPCPLHRVRAWAKLASTPKTSNPGRAVFVSIPQVRTPSSEMRFLYDGGASGQTIYAYVGGNPLSFVDPFGLTEVSPNPNGVVPGGPWTPAGSGQPPGTFYGPKTPGQPQNVCRYVPGDATGTPHDPYWKAKQGGSKGWQRYAQNGNPIPPEQAHPGNRPAPSAPPVPPTPPSVPWWVRVGVGIGAMFYSSPAY